jgi:hypothetical protein
MDMRALFFARKEKNRYPFHLKIVGLTTREYQLVANPTIRQETKGRKVRHMPLADLPIEAVSSQDDAECSVLELPAS